MKNNKSIYIVGIFMLITMVSIGYAILTGQLNINGSAKVKAALWDIYFANVKVKNGSVTASVKPSITDKTTVNFEIDLNKPGDFYEFNVDVVNDGDLDAMIESISITPELTVNQQKYLSYSVTYLDDVPLEVKDILHAQKTRTLKVRVEYLKSVENSELNSNDETLNVKATIKYVQADATAKESSSNELEPKLINVLSGNGIQVGDEIAIGDEHFYVISNDGTNITMLAKYNLLVGNSCTSNDFTSCPSLENVTGIQDLNATAWHTAPDTEIEEYPMIGGTPFSSSAYWGNVANGTYVYDNRASISAYLNNYKTYLQSFGVNINEVRIMNGDEIGKFNISFESSTTGIFQDTPEWVYSSSYWIGLAYDSNNLWVVASNGSVTVVPYNFSCVGVRPVIVIPADSI